MNESIPMLIDLHLHSCWTDFDHEVQEKRTKQEAADRIREFLRLYRKNGIYLARDAGGYDKELTGAVEFDKRSASAGNYAENTAENAVTDNQAAGNVPNISTDSMADTDDCTRLIPNAAMLTLSDDEFAGVYKEHSGSKTDPAIDGLSVKRRTALSSQASQIEQKLLSDVVSKSGYEWVKIFITGGVGTDKDKATEPLSSRDRFFEAVKRLHQNGKKIMVHCWGGASLDWCIEAGVETVEHAVYMTKEQAAGLAEKDIALIPTTAIYRLLAEKPELFGIPETLRENAAYACDAHAKAVGYALREGVTIGYGTDFYADPRLAEYALYEFEVLREYGLSYDEAVAAGTVSARKILGI